MLRIVVSFVVLALVVGGGMLAPTAVRGEPASQPGAPAGKGKGHLAAPSAAPEIITDLSRLPAPVARTRERLLNVARSGDLQQLAALVNEAKPIYAFTDEKDPIAFWRANYPDSEGIEVLSILTLILETGFVHIDVGTPQEMYVWPYFVRMSLATLTPAQKVELFRIVTGADYKDMLAFGAYAFHRLGIGPDGTWHFFVAGD